jgi:dTMP kinase
VGFTVGYFITFEGVEGCGKTTQIKLLGGHLESLGYSVLLTREPGGCVVADKIRAILLDADNRDMCSLTELFLYAAARAQHVSEVILPALKAGSIVLCDRFTDATIAYQSAGRGLERSSVDTLNLLACQSLRPDLTVLLDCDAAIGLGRARSRIEAQSGPREERFELEELEFHQRVRVGYLTLARQEPQRFITVTGSGSIEEISTRITDQVLQNRLRNNRYDLL